MAPSLRASAHQLIPTWVRPQTHRRLSKRHLFTKKCDKCCILHASPFLPQHTLTLACAHTSQDDSYNCRDGKFTKSPVEGWRTRGGGLWIRGTRHGTAGFPPLCAPPRTKPGVRHPASARGLPVPTGGDVGLQRGDARQGSLLSQLLEELILVGEPGAGGGRSHGRVWTVRRLGARRATRERTRLPGTGAAALSPGAALTFLVRK